MVNKEEKRETTLFKRFEPCFKKKKNGRYMVTLFQLFVKHYLFLFYRKAEEKEKKKEKNKQKRKEQTKKTFSFNC